MDPSIFAEVRRTLAAAPARRALLRALGGAALAAPLLTGKLAAPAAEAKQRRPKAEHNVRGKKAIMCVNGVTKRVPKKRRKHLIKQGATRGACDTTCTPMCPAGACGSDGCGGTCACASGTVCALGTCVPCNVSCNGGAPAECGATLSTQLLLGGDAYVCPGEYRNNYPIIGVSGRVFGAGSGSDPATNTVLTGVPGANAPIMVLQNVPSYQVYNVRFTGNTSTGPGAGVAAFLNAVLSLTDCAVTGNTAGQAGGGVLVFTNSTLSLDGCEISGNTTATYGGGIASVGVLNVTNTRITGNTAATGGGIQLDGSGVTTLDATVSITGNTATGGPPAGGGVLVVGGTFNRNGATISGNTPDQCDGAGC